MGFAQGVRRAALVLGLLAIAAPAGAEEAQIRALQEGLTQLGHYKGPVDGEESAALDEGVARYVAAAGFNAPAPEAFRNRGALLRDVDLELRIRAGKAKVAGQQAIRTRFGDLVIATYRQDDAPPGFADGRRVSLRGERVDAGLAIFAECCKAERVEVGPVDVVVIQGETQNAGCALARVYVTVAEDRMMVADGEDSCAPQVRLAVEGDALVVEAPSRLNLLDGRWRLTPGKPLVFERLVVVSDLQPLLWWVGRQPFERNHHNYRFFHYAPLADALAALLEPEALGWTLKMTLTNPVERRGSLLFVSGSFKPDETLVSVTVDLDRRAVHACAFNDGRARFASTMLAGQFIDPAASCPFDAASAEATWSGFGVTDQGRPGRVFAFEGRYGDKAQCKAGDEAVTRITARAVRTPGEPPCALESVGIADGFYRLATSCRVIPVKRLDEDRIDFDGEILARCPERR